MLPHWCENLRKSEEFCLCRQAKREREGVEYLRNQESDSKSHKTEKFTNFKSSKCLGGKNDYLGRQTYTKKHHITGIMKGDKEFLRRSRQENCVNPFSHFMVRRIYTTFVIKNLKCIKFLRLLLNWGKYSKKMVEITCQEGCWRESFFLNICLSIINSMKKV